MNPGRRIGTGASSVLMIFVVLCLTAFGVLSLVSARADRHLTDRAQAAAEAYYAADAAVEETLAAIDAALARAGEATGRYLSTGTCDILPSASLPESSAGAQAVYETLAAHLLAGIGGVTVTDNTVTFTQAADERKQIAVALTLQPYGQSPRYAMTARRALTLEEGGDPTLQVWPGK